MRTAVFVLWLGLGGAVSACKAKADADAPADPAAAKEQEELLKRRDALISARQKLLQDRAQIQQQLHDGSAGSSSGGGGSSGDMAELLKKMDDIDAKLDNNGNDTTKLLDEQVSTRAVPSNAGNAEVARELVQLRELEDAARARERELAAALAEANRQAEGFIRAADKWKDTCQAGTTIVTAPVAPVKGTFTKTDVQGVLTHARATMGKKGLRSDDLGAAAGLEAEATKAMTDGEWGHAMGAANQLNAQVDSIRIDKAFILQKFGRLKDYVAAHKEASQQASGALQDITQKFGDGNYDGANRRINELWAQLGR